MQEVRAVLMAWVRVGDSRKEGCFRPNSPSNASVKVWVAPPESGERSVETTFLKRPPRVEKL